MDGTASRTNKKQQNSVFKHVGLLRFGSFWAQNVCNIALIIYKYIPVWCTAWYGRYGHREPKNETPPIWLILSPKWAKSEESNMFKNTILFFLSVRLAVPSIQCIAQSCKFFPLTRDNFLRLYFAFESNLRDLPFGFALAVQAVPNFATNSRFAWLIRTLARVF